MTVHSNLNQLFAIKKTTALILAGGRGSRLRELTDVRAKPAVHFGGKFRIIDFALSNCLNSGIRKMGIMTQYKSDSLLTHVQDGWSFLNNNHLGEFVRVLPAQQRIDEVHWYLGTADAVYQNLDILRSYDDEYILILSGDHVYKMDYSLMLMDHIKSISPCSIACIEVPRENASAFGCMQVDEDGLVTDFIEKPENPPAVPGKPDKTLISMGIYVFEKEFLYRLLEEDHAEAGSSHDFGKDIIPKIVKKGLVHAHNYEVSCVRNRTKKQHCYWRDVGTVDSFWVANMDLTREYPDLDIYDPSWPIWTSTKQLPPAKFIRDSRGTRTITENSVIAAGSVIFGSEVADSVLFSHVTVEPECCLEKVVLFPMVTVNRGCHIRKAIIERKCEIPANFRIGFDPEQDRRYFYVSPGGVVLVTRAMLAALREDRPDLF
ncbi:glucose-1-phosphate adenylyltransferase [Succinimonas amylolytica]|uniref:glucose-1-phosphate adenylyltransferase n=1 Tax=Succinimonas amylolytica TaxID=83769 RepID=UPI00037539F4|nr:glucose-1-phosphate adenylyltransferase [Succinimonas amylolytica]